MSKVSVPSKVLTSRGVEVLSAKGDAVSLPRRTRLEAPCSLKWTQYEHSLEMGAFSYQVSGFCCAAKIGRYCSFGEEVQIGRQNHPLTWASTSPAFYLGARAFDAPGHWRDAAAWRGVSFSSKSPPTTARVTTIGHDVWIGHGAYVAAGVSIGHGAIIAGEAVVVSDVPPYAVVAGNPAAIKKLRVPSQLLSPMLRSRWWRFAPWQLAHLDPSDSQSFVAGVLDMHDVAPFEPEIVDLEAIVA